MKLHPVSPEKLVHILEHMGFERVRQKGSHELLRHPDGRTVTIPVHGGADIGTGLLEHMLRNIGMPHEEFMEALRHHHASHHGPATSSSDCA